MLLITTHLLTDRGHGHFAATDLHPNIDGSNDDFVTSRWPCCPPIKLSSKGPSASEASMREDAPELSVTEPLKSFQSSCVLRDAGSEHNARCSSPVMYCEKWAIKN